MKSLSSIGLGLSVVFGCLLLALVAELYYLLWWKKRFITRDIENDFSNPARDFLYMFCCRQNPSLFSSSSLTTQEMTNSTSLVAGTQLGQNKDLWVKPMNDNEYDYDMCNYYLGQDQNPRYLFTIVEETKEDLESEDGKSSKSRKGSRNLSDLFVNNNLVETPYLTPIDSPSFFVTTPPAPPLTPLMKPTSCFYNNSNSNINNYNNNTNHGFNPLLESSTDAEFSRIRSSPPPKFKFLQDAEEKLYRRRLMEEDEVSEKKKNGSNNITTKINTNNIDGFSQENGRNEEEEEEEEEEGSFITIIVDRNKEKATCSQVIPLASSPSTTFSDHHHHHQQQQYSRIISKFP